MRALGSTILGIFVVVLDFRTVGMPFGNLSIRFGNIAHNAPGHNVDSDRV